MKKILFFDTETTGLPLDWSARVHDVDNWPRVVQLAFAHYDEEGNVLAQHCYIITPEGYEIPKEVSDIHRVTTERAIKYGVPLEYALKQLGLAMDNSDLIVAHNISFDRKVLGAEYIRQGREDQYELLKLKENVDTMHSSTKFCAIPSTRGNKWPKLQELHMKLFEVEFEEAHDALVDVNATAKCYFELKRLNVI